MRFYVQKTVEFGDQTWSNQGVSVESFQLCEIMGNLKILWTHKAHVTSVKQLYLTAGPQKWWFGKGTSIQSYGNEGVHIYVSWVVSVFIYSFANDWLFVELKNDGDDTVLVVVVVVVVV